jgi:hypothetical protein
LEKREKGTETNSPVKIKKHKASVYLGKRVPGPIGY